MVKTCECAISHEDWGIDTKHNCKESASKEFLILSLEIVRYLCFDCLRAYQKKLFVVVPSDMSGIPTEYYGRRKAAC